MSTTQRVIWTACPNGVASNGRLRVSVAVGPQLFPPLAVGTLGQFPDWADWPATRVTWKAVIGTDTVAATVVSARPSSALYQALFRASTPVDSYQYKSPSDSRLYSNPAATVQGTISRVYGNFAATVPPDGSWHDYDVLTSTDIGLGVFPLTYAELQARIENLAKLLSAKTGGTVPLKLRETPYYAIPLTYQFLQPRVKAKSTPRPPVPTFDFHKAYSLLQRHPALMRLFGFVIDLEVPRPAGLPASATVALSVMPSWTPRLGAARTTNIRPVTMTDSATWLAAPRPGSPQIPTVITAGVLPLDDTGSYAVVEMDADGTVLKTLNFVQAIYNAVMVRRSADTPQTYGAPALRSAGLSLSMLGHAELVYGNWLSSDMIATTMGGSGPVTLYAEDIALGYRADVWDSRHARWFTLSARSGNPRGINGYGIGEPQHLIPVPAGDEGWVEPATTQSPTPAVPPQVFLPETLLRWSGWSLVAPRPGMHLSEDASDSLEADDGNPPPPGADFPLQIDYAATPGTLPALRFGRTYRLRARVVDLAGNSLPFDENAPFTHATPPVTYGRLEPVASPVIVPCAPRTPGESLETLVIRSNYDIPDASVTPCQRHLAPPATAIELAEAHGALDDAAGVPRKDLYATLKHSDGLSYKSPQVLSQYGGEIQTIPVPGGGQPQEWIYYPPDPAQPLGVPYLPDVLGCGASLYGLPGALSSRLTVTFGTGWPARRTIRLVVAAGGGPPSSPAAGPDEPLTVQAPKATVTTVRLSSWFPPGGLAALKLWQWLTSAGLAPAELTALERLILDGGHYMFTPYRELTIVHAVRQPVTAPQLTSLALPPGAPRLPGATYALLDAVIDAHPPSTQRIDVLSTYTDPYDDGVSALGAVPQPHRARVDEVQLASDGGLAFGVTGIRHDFGDTKHHAVSYSLLATTRFLEYFTASASVVLRGTAPAEVSPEGFAQGTVVVTGTGAAESRTYTAGKDFTEDDTAGTIARIAGGRIADGATVQVVYVAPPVTRSSLEAAAHPPTPLGYALDIPSSQRPPAPDVRSVIPVFGWHRTSSAAGLSSRRAGSMLRVYLGRPWFQSGAGECLGVIVTASPPSPKGLPADVAQYVSGYGHDPLFVTGIPVPTQFTLADFTLATATGPGVQLAEQAEAGSFVGVAGHEVAWDAARQLWYADIAMSIQPSYFPFVKLGLVRYQPSSLRGIEVSTVVQADFLQVAPDRTMALTFPGPALVRVTVSGPGYRDAWQSPGPSRLRAYVQEATVETSDPYLTWTTVPDMANGSVLTLTSETEVETVWTGELMLPAPRGSKKFRVLVTESELRPVLRAGNASARITYLDAVEI